MPPNLIGIYRKDIFKNDADDQESGIRSGQDM